ncbi:hypothetical protein [Streptomyces sp. NPDC001914]|uniref:hypothetical protein n=1 Tax=Streptomyces sp. NPDC001914 TaxID=3364623 RepID=UPI003681B31F
MTWVVGTGAFLGMLAIVLGVVTIRTGWLLPTARRHVTRSELHGFGAVLTGAPVVVQSLFYFRLLPSVSWEVRFFGGNALLLAGLILMILSQLPPLGRSREQADSAGVRMV